MPLVAGGVVFLAGAILVGLAVHNQLGAGLQAIVGPAPKGAQ